MLRERGKGCIFSAAYQGKVRETAQMILEASALCFAQASHSCPAHLQTTGRVGREPQMGQTDLGVRLDLGEVS